MEKNYRFYGWESPIEINDQNYPGIHNIRDLYDVLSDLWCEDTCAPRMRKDWTKENMTLGQCSITAFLVQDILGGEVYGVDLKDGNYHCYNRVDGYVFDLTSEQFLPEKLTYDCRNPQSRETHFSKEEKRLRYEKLKASLEKYLEKTRPQE
ncbi:MAG: hypothetical protein J5365_02945 [Erysipelotrichaceae bacterium]|nr:hypothetical protein [Erysipelotrichaceae bacterium]